MIRTYRRYWPLVGTLISMLLLAACGPLPLPKIGGGDLEDVIPTGGSAPVTIPASATAARAPQAQVPGRQTVAVRRGSIAEQLTLYGTVVGRGEKALSFQQQVRISSVSVKPGDAVIEGQVVLEADSRDIAREISDTQLRIGEASARIDQARIQAAQRAQAEEDKNQARVAEALATLQKARSDLNKINAAPPTIRPEQKAAADALAQVVANLDKAQADRDSVINSGSDQASVRVAQGEELNAQIKLNDAQAAYDRLSGGPDPAAVRAVQHDIDRAHDALKSAQAMPTPDEKAHAAQDRAVADAQYALQDAQARMSKLKEPANASAVDLARYNLDSARQSLQVARDRLQALEQGPDPTVLDKANNAVADAQTVRQVAETRLAAISAVDPGPSQQLLNAQDKVDAAQAALDRARAAASAAPSDSGTADLEPLQKNLDQDRQRLAALQNELEATRLRAPFAGTITGVLARPGESLDQNRSAVMITPTGDRLLRVALTDRDAGRVAVGQAATVQLEAPGAGLLKGSMDELVKTADDSVAAALVKVNWSNPLPAYGSSAQVVVTLRQRDGVLLVPKRAVHSAGERRYVEVLEGTGRKVLSVQVGATSGNDTEVVSGLADGQLVLVAP